MRLREKNIELGNFGIEIECIGVNKDQLASVIRSKGVDARVENYNHSNRSYWKLIYDASIRGRNRFENVRGCELVSPVLNGIDGLNQIEKVCEALSEVGARVNISCGLHVHHDASSFNSYDNLKKVVKIYKRSEILIDSLMPKSRRGNNNIYCKSVLNVGEDFFDQRDSNRYHKINLQSWFRHGTVEFRHHSGTVEAEKIINWVLFTALIVEKAKGRVISEKVFARWVDLKWFLGVTTSKIDDRFKNMVSFYENRRRSFRAA